MRAVAVLCALAALAGCAGDSQPASISTPAVAETPPTVTTSRTAPTATSAPATVTTAAATSTSTTTTSSTTTSTLPLTKCPVPAALPEGAVRYAGASGDYDGDGEPDAAITYQTAPDTWRLRMMFADGGGVDAAIADAVDFAPPRAFGGFDIDGDETDEAFVTVGAGASTVQIGLFDVANCAATRITEGGTAAVFAVGASVGNVSGLVCAENGIIERVFAQYVDEDVYEGGFAPYGLEGAVLTALPGDGAVFTAEEAFALAVLDCGLLSLP